MLHLMRMPRQHPYACLVLVLHLLRDSTIKLRVCPAILAYTESVEGGAGVDTRVTVLISERER